MNKQNILNYLRENRIEELKNKIEQELAIETAKNKDIQKGLLALSRDAFKSCYKNMDLLAGAWIDEENKKTYICNGFYIYVANKIINGLVEVEKKGREYININNILENFKNKNFNEIKLDLAKLTLEKVYKKQYVKVDNIVFDIKLLLLITKCFDLTLTKIYLYDNAIRFIDTDKNEAILLCCRISSDKKSDVVEVAI